MDLQVSKPNLIGKYPLLIIAVFILAVLVIITMFKPKTQSKTKIASAAVTPVESQKTPSTTPTSLASTQKHQILGIQTRQNPTSPTSINFTICLHGIGSCGDNVAAQSKGNMTPAHTSRQAQIDIYNTDNNLIKTITTNITYSQTSGNFISPVMTQIPSGNYNIKISVHGYLSSFISTPQTIAANQINSISMVSLVTGDINGNNALDKDDYNRFMKCYEKPSQPATCTENEHLAADLNDDGKVNGLDYNLFMRETINQKTLN